MSKSNPTFFVGVVPPETIVQSIITIQKAYGDNRLEPHITLRPPVVPLHPDQWIDCVTRIAANFDKFKVQLTGTDYFDKRVLFISVNAAMLINLYHELIPALKLLEPEEKNAGSARFHPHLTLGRTWCGFSIEDFKAMQLLADEYLKTGNNYFNATHLRIYHKPTGQGRFKAYKDVPLGG